MAKKFLVPALLICSLASCSEKKAAKDNKPDILASNIDTTVFPYDDFFEFANGQWLKNNPIPGEETSWGIAHLVNEELYNRKLTINIDAVKKSNKTANEKQIADFWTAAMDSSKIEKDGLKPLEEHLKLINSIQNAGDVMRVAGQLHTIGANVFFSEGVAQDAMNSEVMSYQLFQGGLGLPNRDYYFNNDTRTASIRNAYPAYVGKIFRLLGNDSVAASQKAATVISIETQLAKASRKLEDLRDPYANYNKMSLSGLQATAPGVDWSVTFKAIGLDKVDTIIVGQPEFYKALSKIVTTEPVEHLKDYMSYHLVNAFANYLSDAFVDAKFDFFGKTIRGAKEMRPRWKRVLDSEEASIGELLGQLFAKEYFDEKAKARYSEMVERVRTAYQTRIEKLDWMSDSTKKKAIVKLKAMTKKVGYPDRWKDFSSLTLDAGTYAGNVMKANAWWNRYYLNKLGKPIDRTEWEMTPQTYNAYYNPSNNEIVLPAGIFTVPGYRDEELDDALVYGYAAASTIGHEITHGFDDEGRQYDEKGNLHNWWTSQDETQFKQRAAVLSKQFNNVVVLDSLHINGNATLGENLADLGGILIGLDAFKQTDAYKKGEKISGYTPVQRFFLGYALGWLYQIRSEQLASQLLTDVHAPAKYRVNGPFPNVPEFYEAFGIKEGSKMYLADSVRVRLW